MKRYIVTPALGPSNSLYYLVTDTATGMGMGRYGCEIWAQHRANALNRQKKGDAECTNASTVDKKR